MDSLRADGLSLDPIDQILSNIEEPLRIIICGSRYWKPHALIRRELDRLPRNTTIIHGCADGVDRIADTMARELGFTKIKQYPAKWDLYGRAAGPIRNKKMYDDNFPHLVLAFSQNIGHSRGTRSMVRYAQSRGGMVKIVSQ